MRARNPFRLEHFVKRAVEPVVLKTRFEQRRDFESGRSHGVPPLRRGRFSNSNTRRERTKNRSKTVLKNRFENRSKTDSKTEPRPQGSDTTSVELSTIRGIAPLKTHVPRDRAFLAVPSDARGYGSASSSPLVGQQAHGHSLAVAARLRHDVGYATTLVRPRHWLRRDIGEVASNPN